MATWNNWGDNLFSGADANQMMSISAPQNNQSLLGNWQGNVNQWGNEMSSISGSAAPLTKSLGGWNTFSNILGGISGAANAFTGFKQLGLAKKQFNWQKDAFNTNLVNQANVINQQLERKAVADKRWGGDSAPDPAEVMRKYGVASSVGEAKQRQQQNQNAWNTSQGMNKLQGGG